MTISSSSRPTNPRLALLVIAVVFAILNADITTVNVALVTLGKAPTPRRSATKAGSITITSMSMSTSSSFVLRHSFVI